MALIKTAAVAQFFLCVTQALVCFTQPSAWRFKGEASMLRAVTFLGLDRKQVMQTAGSNNRSQVW